MIKFWWVFFLYKWDGMDKYGLGFAILYIDDDEHVYLKRRISWDLESVRSVRRDHDGITIKRDLLRFAFMWTTHHHFLVHLIKENLNLGHLFIKVPFITFLIGCCFRKIFKFLVSSTPYLNIFIFNNLTC